MKFLLAVVALVAIFIIVYKQKRKNDFEQTSYFKITHNSLAKIEADKGVEGEYLIYKELAEYEKDGAKLLFNCYIPTRAHTMSEIDVLMLHRSGIYVFESKNYSGWIFGSEQDEEWTQSLLFRGHEPQREYFFNPVLQNKLHIKHLCELLKIKQEHVYSVIVFSDRCELKSITLYNQAIKVLHLFQLRHGISGFLEKTVLSEADIARLYNLLYPYTQLSEEKKQEHIRNIELDQESREAKRGKICPVCGGELVVRTVKRGEWRGQTFYGCSAYPKCHYTEKM